MINNSEQYYYCKGLLRYFYSTSSNSWEFAVNDQRGIDTIVAADYMFYMKNLMLALHTDFFNYEE